MKCRLMSLVCAVAVLVSLCGCGGEKRDSGSVSGKVTIGGQPAKDLIVRFQPKGTGDVTKRDAGMGSYGQTDEEGMYTLKFSDDDRAGALVGEHVVTIDELTPPEEEDNDAGFSKKSTSRIPRTWSATEHTYTVESGSNEANFELNGQ
jgi:hypothetical protein